MASLVAPLVSGISTAPTGTVEFYLQGTSTPAPVYFDPEGEILQAVHVLDARGSMVRYVEARVDVVVKNVGGAIVTAFTWGTDAREARVENLGWTGPNAVGAIVAGGRTTVDDVLTRLFGSLGALDGQVLVNGVPTDLGPAISSSAGLVYNVKSGYGATGNGSTDDSPAIQAAMNAAATAGGGIIYFPHGDYRLNSSVSVADGEGKFTYWGESATGVSLIQGTSGITMLGLGGSNNNLIMGITFTSTSDANTGALVSVGLGGRATFLNCAFGALNGTTVACADGASTAATFINCVISQAGALSRIGTGISVAMRFVGCDISTSGEDLTSFDSGTAVISFASCTIRLGYLGGDAASSEFIDGSITGSFVGCRFVCEYDSGTVAVVGSTSGTFSGCVFEVTSTGLLTMAGAGSVVIESASDVLTTGITVGGSTSATFRSQRRDHRMTQISGGAETTYTPSSEYMFHEVSSGGASMLFNTPDPNVPTGQALVILYENTSGGNITPTFSAAYSFIVAPAVVNAGNSALYYFLARFNAITSDLICISPQPSGGVAI